jgi:Na+-transporting methylmalonyl-CoA/oxaloacetate decarboxylase gamma subunit
MIPENIILVLQITVIGMGLVFGAIILLWGVMALLVRLSSEDDDSEEEFIIVTAGEGNDFDQKRQAAIAAVAIALAKQSTTSEPQPFPLPPAALVSAWQAVSRSRTLTKRRSGR